MARDITVRVYQYAELSEAAKTRAREWWRSMQIAGDHAPWSESPTTDLKTIAALMGWTVKDTAFTGFGAQGDGAQFTGAWRAADVKGAAELEEYAPAGGSERNARLIPIMTAIASLAREAPDTHAAVSGNGPYSHSMATRFDISDLTNAQLDTLAEHSRALMDWYYTELEASYEWYLSDEQAAEVIEANEYEFKANGDRFCL